ncbi:hypothetical protein OESDEN_15299 [Oesophagostomum dentatum]|uniref:Uncharacterized protein n=1 Tax=Oesophagostomum dentatum TaxID=61180 RepID=A0A0B1SM68_OESDE|nr:hypothetical protein OESDEN_15299 [Oesophagostomum dentatum]
MECTPNKDEGRLPRRAQRDSGLGVFEGKPDENFMKFIRRFRREHKRVNHDDMTLAEILGDDHLSGRAENIFLTLPGAVKANGFEAMVYELGRLLANDSVAARMKGFIQLRSLRMQPRQDIKRTLLQNSKKSLLNMRRC